MTTMTTCFCVGAAPTFPTSPPPSTVMLLAPLPTSLQSSHRGVGRISLRTFGRRYTLDHDDDRENGDPTTADLAPGRKIKETAANTSRRALLRGARTVLFGALFPTLAPMTPAPLTHGPVAHAACLSGDDSPDCIGVYKLPPVSDDPSLLPYVETPERLRTYAPDVRWVKPDAPPLTSTEAIGELRELRNVIGGSVVESVSAGRLEEAGRELLRTAPRVSMAGRVVVSDLYRAGTTKGEGGTGRASQGAERSSGEIDLSLRAQRAEVALDDLLAILGECDVLLGQGLRGDLGVTAPAQIQILSTLRDVTANFDVFLKAVPESFSGATSPRRSSRAK